MSDNNDKKRINFTLRLQPYADSPEGAVLTYLNSRGRRSSNELVLQFLRMCFLPLAYKEQGGFSTEELRVIALETCDTLEKHISHIRTLFYLERPTQQIPPSATSNDQSSISPQPQSQPLPESQSKKVLDIEGDGTFEEAGELFSMLDD